MTTEADMSEREKAVGAARRFEKLAAEYERDATEGYAYDVTRSDGSHVNPNAERSRQTAILLREAASALAALAPLRAGQREKIARIIAPFFARDAFDALGNWLNQAGHGEAEEQRVEQVCGACGQPWTVARILERISDVSPPLPTAQEPRTADLKLALVQISQFCSQAWQSDAEGHLVLKELGRCIAAEFDRVGMTCEEGRYYFPDDDDAFTPTAQEEGWREIGSAPKDRPLDLYSKSKGRLAGCRWSQRLDCWWWLNGSHQDGYPSGQKISDATHYMLIPSPPRVAEPPGGETKQSSMQGETS